MSDYRSNPHVNQRRFITHQKPYGDEMPSWNYKVNIQHLFDNDTDDHALRIAREIVTVIRKTVPLSWLDGQDPHNEFDLVLSRIVDDLIFLPPSIDCDIPKRLNAILSKLYEWADCKRVWLGP